MSKTRVIIFAILLAAGFYDILAEWKLTPWPLPTISKVVNDNVYQFSFWEFTVGLALGHLLFNRNKAKPGT